MENFITPDMQAKANIEKMCLICSEGVPCFGDFRTPVICDKCKAAVLKIRNAEPAVDAAPVVHGHWEKSDIPHEKFCCSVCGGACWYYDYAGDVARSRYCPNCGAKMDGGSNETD
jgi:hypothetical protein